MRTATEKRVRELLRANPEGLTIKEVIDATNKTDRSIRMVLRNMPDAYIDRWVVRYRAVVAAVWCVVVPPENCPKPKSNRSK